MSRPSHDDLRASTHAYCLELTERSLKPNAEAIAAIVARGGIAVVMDPPEEPVAGLAESLRAMGRTGDEHVFRMTSAAAKRMAANIKASHPADKVTPRWLLSKRDGRIFVISPIGGSMLVNFTPGEGFSLEPGQSDLDWKS